MTPSRFMTTGHHRLKESSKNAITSPSNSVAFLYSALNDDIVVHYGMDVNPDSVVNDLLKFCTGINIFLELRSFKFTPKSFAAASTVLRKCPGSNSQWRWFLLAGLKSLFLLLSENSVRRVKAFFELLLGGPRNLLRAWCLSMTKHCHESSGAHIKQKIFYDSI